MRLISTDALLKLVQLKEEADGPEAGTEGVAIAREIAHGLRPHVQGVQISTTSGQIEAALGIIESVR